MNKKFSYILLFLSIIATQSSFGQQRKVLVPEGFGTLNEAIRNDTLQGGRRVDPNTSYVLKRGGVYILSGTIVASGFDLTIEAEPGSGPRPYIIMGFLTGAAQVDESIKVFNSLTMKSIHMTNINEFQSFIGRMVSVDAQNVRLLFDDCIFDRSGQTFLRLNSAGAKIYMYNCTVSRMGRPSNPDNGRVIDDRGNMIDSIIVENNTWYNVTSRVIRDGGEPINYLSMNQNTFVNIGQRFSQVGSVKEMHINNNLIVNPRYIGNSETSSIVAFEFNPTDQNAIINLNFNNIFYQKEVSQIWNEISSNRTSPIITPPFVAPENQRYISSALGLISEELSFSNGPIPPTQVILISETGEGSSVPDWDWSNTQLSEPWELNQLAYHTFSYPASANSFRASNTKEPLGDLRWFDGFDIPYNLSKEIARTENILAYYKVVAQTVDIPISLLDNIEDEITRAKSQILSSRSTRKENAESILKLKNSLKNVSQFFITTGNRQNDNHPKIYPNPFQDNIVIEQKVQEIIKITLYNMSGLAIYGFQPKPSESNFYLGNLKKGIYILQLESKTGEVWREKLIKM